MRMGVVAAAHSLLSTHIAKICCARQMVGVSCNLEACPRRIDVSCHSLHPIILTSGRITVVFGGEGWLGVKFQPLLLVTLPLPSPDSNGLSFIYFSF